MTIAVWTLVFGSFKVYAGFIYTVVNGIVVFVYLDTMWIGYAVPFALSLFSVVFTTVLMIPIARRSYLQQGYEGSFRFGHSRVKEFAECVAFYAGQKKEHRLAEGRFNDVYVNNAKLLRRQFALNLFNGIFVQLMSIAMVLSVMYIQTHSPKDECGNDTLQGHPVNVGSVQQLFIKMTTAAGLLAVLVRLYGSLGVAAGYVHRIGELFETFDEWERVFARFESERRIQYTNEHAEPKVEAHKISLALPSGGPLLLHNVSFTVKAGKSLIIMGPSGSGKSSLLRVLAGLWPFNNGHLVRPRGVGRGGVFFLPQRPYTVLGSLRDQIAFPHSVHPSDEGSRPREGERGAVCRVLGVPPTPDDTIHVWQRVVLLSSARAVSRSRSAPRRRGRRCAFQALLLHPAQLRHRIGCSDAATGGHRGGHPGAAAA